ncbi:MAG: nucleotide sugar dehydrogenase [Dermatophilaceae bacterium]
MTVIDWDARSGTALAVEFGDEREIRPDQGRPGFDADVAILGLGYVGLPTALAFHAAGARVIGVDISSRRLADVASGAVDLLDSDHERLVKALASDACLFTTDPRALSRARAVIVCVPTPVDEYLVPDLEILRRACGTVVDNAVPGQVLIMTSTTYVGCTTDFLVRPLAERGLTAGADVFVAFSPERIDPGNYTHAQEDVPRVVGGVTQSCTTVAGSVLAGYVRKVHPVSSPAAAEMTKLLENTFRAVNIALANEFAEASHALQVDVMEVLDAAATKPFGFMRFNPGPGVGGHCIPCDPHYLLWQLKSRRITSPVIEQAMTGIAGRPSRLVDRAVAVLAKAGRSLVGARVLVVGVAYKPNVEDVRESPALEVLDRLLDFGAQPSYHDPLVPSVRLGSGTVLASVADPDPSGYDLVIAHTWHTRTERALVADAPLVLDATYRVSDLPSVHRL